ncbi:MAG: TIGR03621 family F420-dependent LLM class oxidoreductase [Candidatus Bathyarchaeota archaeon]|nr:TIGR03621 family F420-dependent LLM class oxidoreductase [Candidatus Bathyarchaeota archaeon]
MKPFRFGTFPYPFELINGPKWIETVQIIEKLGYSTLMYPDHFSTRAYDPMVMLASAAATTEKLNLGTLVFDVDFRHPAILSKAAAAMHNLSGGRFEFGIGAGHLKEDYDMTGLPFDPPGVRISRLEEALTIIKSMWTQEKTSYHGKHYSLTDMEKAGIIPEGEHPKVIVGGGGKRLLTVAGRHADIVGIHWNLNDKTPKGLANARRSMNTYEKINERISWVKDSAEAVGRDPDEIEFQIMTSDIKITDDPESAIERLLESYDGLLSYDDLYEHPRFFVGDASHVRDKIIRLRKETGINYMVLWAQSPGMIEEFSKSIIKPLLK